MPELKTYDLFISHAWRHNDDYYRLINLLDNAPYFKYRNYSVPQHDPLVDPSTEIGKRKLSEMLDRQIKPVNAVLILTGMYSIYSSWVLKELSISEAYNKPVIGIIPWGQQKIPDEIRQSCDTMVGWNTESIVNAIRAYSI